MSTATWAVVTRHSPICRSHRPDGGQTAPIVPTSATVG
jgi:hypothetical protein